MTPRRIATALGVLLATAVAALVVYDLAREDRVAAGVTVEGVDVGDRSRSEARAVIAERIARPLERTVVARRGDREFELPPSESGIEVDVDATLEAALDAGSSGVPGVDAMRDLTGGEVDEDVAARARFDRQAVEDFAAEVGSELDREPRDADVSAGASLEVTESREGFGTDTEELAGRVRAALDSRDENEVEVPGETLEPETTMADLREEYPRYITIDRSSFRLRYYEDLELESTYRISVGQAGHHTPAGLYDISTKAVNPAWHVPDEPWAGEQRGEVIPPGPDNPIKARWLGIEDGIGIHGTDERDSIGRRASHGCIRMLIPEVRELYERVPVGTPVYIA